MKNSSSQKSKIRRALISVSDKSGLEDFAKILVAQGIEIVSTGGTAKLLSSKDIPVIDITELTGFPEMMDGRVKTLHPKVHGGILAVRDNENHKSAMRIHQIPQIDLIVVNLYPFEKTIATDTNYNEAIENIDIGGPAMIRSAAKNHRNVTIIVDPGDYENIGTQIGETGEVSAKTRQKLAAKAFARTAAYDAAIANWFAKTLDYPEVKWRSHPGELRQVLRYGENPHQWAAFYQDHKPAPGVATAEQIQGKELSYNNINDTDAAFALVSEFDPKQTAAVAIIKHANPCGVGLGDTLSEAYDKALRCDPVSAFGGVIAINGEISKSMAEKIIEVFTEVIIAPGATPEALAVFEKKKNLRLLITEGLGNIKEEVLDVTSVTGGTLVQSRDNKNIDDCELKVVTKRSPSDTEMADLRLAAIIAKHVKSNAIVFVKNGASVGVGAGQMSRIDSTLIATRKSKDAAKHAGEKVALSEGAVLASDAFFPFADGLVAGIKAGATAIIQPGGSIRDDEVIAAADKAGIAMVFTGMRHFKH